MADINVALTAVFNGMGLLCPVCYYKLKLEPDRSALVHPHNHCKHTDKRFKVPTVTLEEQQ